MATFPGVEAIGTDMRARWQRRLVSGAIVTGMLVGVAFAGSTRSTDAAFVDTESAAATFTALNVPEPVSSTTPGCVSSSGLLGANPVVTIRWRVPAGVTGYSLADAEFGLASNTGLLEPILSGLLQNVSTTGTPSAYVTVINGALLANILGGSKTLGIRFSGPGGWTSDWLVAVATFGLLGANPTCTMSTAPSP